MPLLSSTSFSKASKSSSPSTKSRAPSFTCAWNVKTSSKDGRTKPVHRTETWSRPVSVIASSTSNSKSTLWSTRVDAGAP